LPLFLD